MQSCMVQWWKEFAVLWLHEWLETEKLIVYTFTFNTVKAKTKTYKACSHFKGGGEKLVAIQKQYHWNNRILCVTNFLQTGQWSTRWAHSQQSWCPQRKAVSFGSVKHIGQFGVSPSGTADVISWGAAGTEHWSQLLHTHCYRPMQRHVPIQLHRLYVIDTVTAYMPSHIPGHIICIPAAIYMYTRTWPHSDYTW